MSHTPSCISTGKSGRPPLRGWACHLGPTLHGGTDAFLIQTTMPVTRFVVGCVDRFLCSEFGGFEAELGFAQFVCLSPKKCLPGFTQSVSLSVCPTGALPSGRQRLPANPRCWGSLGDPPQASSAAAGFAPCRGGGLSSLVSAHCQWHRENCLGHFGGLDLQPCPTRFHCTCGGGTKQPGAMAAWSAFFSQ